ncbi:isocitrate lyase/PEP mutase family protein [Bradyrhizobium retamae]|uniref:Oxaloacetate decarboxylase n=1 Tax=Bradyrhizobium retamae TaxID=1300035 RepID=A0A0R3NC68_9BRAD|nr:isocitrate lyase/PEP mutase family protein [Bradyrhizobium retamae]KRR29612.1 oxaloacetate decarboxylase [Bradyrhizobium retamae]
MSWSKQRNTIQSVLAGKVCIYPGSVYDPVSARIAADLGFEIGMLGGSTASLTVLGDPDLLIISMTEVAETVRRITRAAEIPLMVDADHGFGNALSVRRTVQELEGAGAAGLSIEDTLLPQPYGESKTQLLSLEEGLGKMKAAVDARRDRSLALFARTGAASVTSVSDAIARGKAYETTGVDALFFTGVRTKAELAAIATETKLPIMLGSAEGELDDPAFLAANRVRLAPQGHLPFATAALAVYQTLKALRQGTKPKDVKGLPSAEFVNRYMRNDDVKRRMAEFLGINR